MELRRKGFVLTLDVTLAMFILLAVLALVFTFSAKSREDPLPEILMQKTSNDILTVMQHKGILQSFNSTTISADLGLLLPPNYGMELGLQKYFYDGDSGQFVLNGTLTIGGPPPTDKTIVAGERILTNTSNSTDYFTINYMTWLK